METVARLAQQYGVRVIADEIHAPIVYTEHAFVPYLSLPETGDAFSVLSASKAWNLAGLKAGLVVAGRGSAAREVMQIFEGDVHEPSHVGVIAHTTAFREGEAWLDQLISELDANRHILKNLLDEFLPTIDYNIPDGTFLAWLDCRAANLGSDPAAVFLEQGRVALNPGVPFGPSGSGFARLNFGTSPELLVEGVDRMRAALK